MDNFLVLSILFTIFIRWTVSRFSYSGEGKPPLYGDYEAQRHWMEITTNLDVKEWYINSTNNDLLYWGLDYPPLTAYHSYLNGLISQNINSNWTELFRSRGFESYYHKLFMRSSVIIPDILIYFTGTIFYWIQSRNQLTKRAKDSIIFFNLFYPGLILIDHGHFQYNSISLGLTIWAVFFLMHSRIYIGSILFCLAINYKQMSLYHAPPFFFYLLGYALTRKTYFKSIKTLFWLAFVVISTFTIVWSPFYDQIPALLNRIFPVYRGLFEDKVANFWCIMDFVFKLKANHSQERLAFYSLVLTLICLLPSSINLLRDPRLGKFKYALVNSSLVFFLFSYHVHEKQILLPALAVSLTIDQDFYCGMLFYIVSTFSMLPLYMKDDIQLPYFIVTCLFLGFSYVFVQRDIGLTGYSDFTKKSLFILYKAVVLGCALISNLQFFYTPPAKYPDLFTLINAAYSWSLFSLFLIYYHYRQFTFKDKFLSFSPSKCKLNID